MSKKHIRRILVSISTSSYTQRRMLESILHYAQERHGASWRLQLDLGGFVCQRLRNLSAWNCDGIIAYVDNPDERRKFLASGLPTVLIDPFQDVRDGAYAAPQTVVIVNDHENEGRTAAAHFIERHFRSFAYVGTTEDAPWSRRRKVGFVSRLADDGFDCLCYPRPSRREQSDFALEMPRLAEWLKRLPPQTALFAAHDIRGRQVLTAADAAGLDVPNRIAVLGLDNDELLCETAYPSLSSVATDDLALGTFCAKTLEDLFRGRNGGCVRQVSRATVITRASTDLNAVTDPFVNRALSWARAHLAEGASVDAIARGIGYSKRLLQTRARQALGTSLGHEVREIMLSCAAELLVRTNRPVAEIAESCGFSCVSHLSLRFRQKYGKTPLVYRRQPWASAKSM